MAGFNAWSGDISLEKWAWALFSLVLSGLQGNSSCVVLPWSHYHAQHSLRKQPSGRDGVNKRRWAPLTSHDTPKGVQKLRINQGGNELNWRPHVWTWRSFGSNVLYWGKYMWHCWDFWRRQHSFGAPAEIRPPIL